MKLGDSNKKISNQDIVFSLEQKPALTLGQCQVGCTGWTYGYGAPDGCQFETNTNPAYIGLPYKIYYATKQQCTCSTYGYNC